MSEPITTEPETDDVCTAPDGESEPIRYDPETGDGGHCIDTDADHWYDGTACGHCSAEWVNDDEPDEQDGPFCFCGHGPDSHRAAAWPDKPECSGCAAEYADEDEDTDPEHAYVMAVDASGRDVLDGNGDPLKIVEPDPLADLIDAAETARVALRLGTSLSDEGRRIAADALAAALKWYDR